MSRQAFPVREHMAELFTRVHPNGPMVRQSAGQHLFRAAAAHAIRRHVQLHHICHGLPCAAAAHAMSCHVQLQHMPSWAAMCSCLTCHEPPCAAAAHAMSCHVQLQQSSLLLQQRGRYSMIFSWSGQNRAYIRRCTRLSAFGLNYPIGQRCVASMGHRSSGLPDFFAWQRRNIYSFFLRTTYFIVFMQCRIRIFGLCQMYNYTWQKFWNIPWIQQVKFAGVFQDRRI